MKLNPVSWLEIPVVDMARAKAFYASVFQTSFLTVSVEGSEIFLFDADERNPGAGGALIQDPNVTPSATPGLVLYFSCVSVDAELARVEAAGGKVVTPKTSLGKFGWRATFLDSEGNLIGLHSALL